VVKAEILGRTDDEQTDVFFTVSLHGQELISEMDFKAGQEPIWNQMFALNGSRGAGEIQIKIYSNLSEGQENHISLIGGISINYEDLICTSTRQLELRLNNEHKGYLFLKSQASTFSDFEFEEHIRQLNKRK
jgi:hypothetical protein